LLETEDYRIKIKKDKHILLNAKRDFRSPSKSRTIETTLTTLGHHGRVDRLGKLGALHPHTVRKNYDDQDHIKLVGDKHSSGRFISGKSVPRSRPTMFWEH
jgi:hypothetical protein